MWPIYEQGMLKLQKAHDYAAQTFQGSPQQCPDIVATAALGSSYVVLTTSSST